MRMQTALMSDEHTVVTIKQVAAFHLALGGLLQNVVLIMTLQTTTPSSMIITTQTCQQKVYILINTHCRCCHRCYTSTVQACHRHYTSTIHACHCHYTSTIQACHRHYTSTIQACHRHCLSHSASITQACQQAPYKPVNKHHTSCQQAPYKLVNKLHKCLSTESILTKRHLGNCQQALPKLVDKNYSLYTIQVCQQAPYSPVNSNILIKTQLENFNKHYTSLRQVSYKPVHRHYSDFSKVTKQLC